MRRPNSGYKLTLNLDPRMIGAASLGDIFGSNLPRLRELKRKYDPDNVFNTSYDFTSAVEA